jgi:transposase
LELLGETFRAALNELARVAPEWLKPRIKQHWLDWFVHRVEEHRIVKGKEAREAQAIAIGEDGFDLLDALEKDQAVCVCLEQPALKALKLIWEQQYEKVDGKLILPEFERLPSDRVRSPFDLKGCYGKKREKTWVGYKVHLTEACDKDAPSIITNVLVTKASAQEMLAARQVHERLKQNQIVPEEHFLDAGYVSADLVLQCREEGIEIVGPMAHNSTWQHVANKGFALDDFKIDWDKKSVTCPKGKTSKSWTELKSKQGPPMIYTHFSPVDCQSCRSKKHCTKARTQGRGLSFRPKESHELLRKRRAKQKTEQWKVLYSTGRDRGHHLPIGENARASCLTLQGYGQDSATVGGHGSGHQRFEGIQLA